MLPAQQTLSGADALVLRSHRPDAKTVLEACFDTISEDGMDKVECPEGPIYLCGYVPELIGCFIIQRTSAITAEVHVQVIPEYRKDWSDLFCAEVMKWTWENTDFQKLTAQIGVIYPNVKDCALRHGFEIEGMNKHSLRKNGQIHDQWYLGAVRWDS